MTKGKYHQIRLEHLNVVAQSEEQSLEQWKCNREDKQKKDFLNIPRLSLPSKDFEQHTVQSSSFSWTELLDKDTAVMAIPTVDSWGWLSALSLTSSIGVFLVALAYEAGRLAMQWSDPLFWFGLLVLFLPIAARLLSAKPGRRERIALLVVLGMGLYLAKFLQYPLYFSYHDEFIHWRSAQDIATSEHLFHENPLLPISSFYPGLELVANAISSLTGLSPFGTGIVTVSVARLISVLALYLFYEHLSKSARVAGIGTLLYMANPQFLFFQAQFSYESLALPLAVFVLFALTLRHVPAGHQRGLALVIWLGLGAIVITHHITWTLYNLQLGTGSLHQPSQVGA